jgi:hypothetical protein
MLATHDSCGEQNPLKMRDAIGTGGMCGAGRRFRGITSDASLFQCHVGRDPQVSGQGVL